MSTTDKYTEFIGKYPIFANTAFGGRQAFVNAYNLASVYVSYFESTGLKWGVLKSTAIDFKTACELQNRYNQKSGALAAINSDSTPSNSSTTRNIKRVRVDGEYDVEYESLSTNNGASSKQLEIISDNAGYYCQEFENLKDLLYVNQLGDGFLYSHEYGLYESPSTVYSNEPTTIEVGVNSYTRNFTKSDLDVAGLLVVNHQLNSNMVQVSLRDNTGEYFLPDEILYGNSNLIYVNLESFVNSMQGQYTILVTE